MKLVFPVRACPKTSNTNSKVSTWMRHVYYNIVGEWTQTDLELGAKAANVVNMTRLHTH